MQGKQEIYLQIIFKSGWFLIMGETCYVDFRTPGEVSAFLTAFCEIDSLDKGSFDPSSNVLTLETGRGRFEIEFPWSNISRFLKLANNNNPRIRNALERGSEAKLNLERMWSGELDEW